MAMSKVASLSYEQRMLKHFATNFFFNPEGTIYAFCEEFSEAVYDRCLDLPMADPVFRMHEQAVRSAHLGFFPRKYYDAIQTLMLLPMLMGESIEDVIDIIGPDDVINAENFPKAKIVVRGNVFFTEQIYLVYNGTIVAFRDLLMAISALVYMCMSTNHKASPKPFCNTYNFITLKVFGIKGGPRSKRPDATWNQCFADLQEYTTYKEEPCMNEDMVQMDVGIGL